MKQLLEAGVHFGHQTRRWNPKMAEYIYCERNGIYIIDLQKTVKKLEEAYNFVRTLAENGQTILFVGTKKQAADAVKEEASRVGMYYVNARWLGGMLTNFATIRARVKRMEELEAMDADGRMALLPKKEQILLHKELAKLQTNLNGIRNMKKVPDAIFVIDTNREGIALHEAHRLEIPVVGTLDTNCDPDDVEYGIPANDDAIRSVSLLTRIIADACAEIAREVAAGRIKGDRVTEKMIADHLYNPDIPDCDLVIRTSGEQRTSNFLPWEAAYAELDFVPELFPDCGRDVLWRSIDHYIHRDRRFGGVKK